MNYTVRYKMAPASAGTQIKNVEAADLLDAAIQARNFLSLRFPHHIVVSIFEEPAGWLVAARARWLEKVEARR